MNENLKSWSDYYSGYNSRLSNIFLHFPYLYAILKKKPKKIIEIGCGSGDHSRVIKKIQKNISITLLDNDEKILSEALLKNKDFIDDSVYADILNIHDIDKIQYHDVAYSQGLMEHFENEDFIKIIENFRGKVGYFLFSIPSDTYPTKDFGNEILRSKEEVKQILRLVPDITYSVKRYFDIGINTKLVAIKNISSLHRKIGHLLFGSNHLLIEVTYRSK